MAETGLRPNRAQNTDKYGRETGDHIRAAGEDRRRSRARGVSSVHSGASEALQVLAAGLSQLGASIEAPFKWAVK